MTATLRVNEIFGPTIQGEGTAAGRHSLFVRLFDCNLECVWCDTPYTWAVTDFKAAKHKDGIKYDKNEQLSVMTIPEVEDALNALWPIRTQPTLIVISGGEPLMQYSALEELVGRLTRLYCRVHIETAGTILPTSFLTSWVDQFNVSPKLAHSGNRLEKRYKPDVLRCLNSTASARFKFVVRSTHDFEEIDRIVKECDIPYYKVQVMPEGTTAADNIEVSRWIIDDATRRGWGLSFRSHVLIWGDERGR